MELSEALEVSKQHASYMLAKQYDSERDIPLRANSHTDLWPGDRWPEAYLAAGQPERAQAVMETIARSRRPDGSIPHLMQGSHIRAGIETRWIDRQVYRLQGNGAQHLPNGEWVTKNFAPPTLALSALALDKAGLEAPSNLGIGDVAASLDVLYKWRGANGLIMAHGVDELTNSASDLGIDLKTTGKVADPAVNALAIRSGEALLELASGGNSHPLILGVIEQTNETEDALTESLVEDYDKGFSPEQVLAIARLDYNDVRLREADLQKFFTAPDPENSHPERKHLSLAESLEVARLTLYAEASHDYLKRVLPKIAQLGEAGLTRFEGVAPTSNAAVNKYGRKQIWLPTAAEIVQIDLQSL